MIQRNPKLHRAWVLGLILAVLSCIGTVFGAFGVFMGGTFIWFSLLASVLRLVLIFKTLSYTKQASLTNNAETCKAACLGWILVLCVSGLGLILALPSAVLCLGQINGGENYGM